MGDRRFQSLNVHVSSTRMGASGDHVDGHDLRFLSVAVVGQARRGEFMGYCLKTDIFGHGRALLYALIFAPAFGNLLMGNRAGSVDWRESVQLLWNLDINALTGLKKIYVKILSFAVKHALLTTVIALAVVYAIFAFHGSRNLGVIFFNENDPQWANLYVRAQGNLDAEEAYSGPSRR